MKNRLLLITLLITVALTGKTKKVATELPTSTKTETDATPKPVKSEEMPVESEIPTDEPVKRSETYEKPEIYMVEPIFRTGSDGTTVGKWPCGGPVKGKGHMLVSPASTTFFQWKIVKGTPEGNCTVSIGPGVGTVDDWVKMAPRDGSADPHTMKFPCGRNDRSHETKWFVMPEDMKCDDCTIQLVWETVNGEIYQCSDLALMDADDAAPCIGKCQNGGACVNGYCRCPENYLGKYCESRVATSSKNGWMWLLFIALFLLIILLFACAYHMIKNRPKSPPKHHHHVHHDHTQKAKVRIQDVVKEKVVVEERDQYVHGKAGIGLTGAASGVPAGSGGYHKFEDEEGGRNEMDKEAYQNA